MGDQSMPYPTIGVLEASREIRLKINDQWVEAKNEPGDIDLIWGDNEIDLSQREDVSEIEVSFRIETDVTDYLRQVVIEHKPGVDGMQTIDSQLGFMVRWINKSLRRRRSKFAPIVSLETRGSGKSQKKILVAECRDIRMKRSEINERITFEPLVFAKTDIRIDPRAIWAGGPQRIGRGSSVGWANPLEVIISRRIGDLGSIFRFVWQDFETSKADRPESIFRVDWSSEPTIYLNKGVEEFEQVLLNVSNSGRAASIRDFTNALIVMQALSIAAVSALRECEGLLKEGEFSADDVLHGLSSQNRLLLEAFGFLFLPEPSARFTATEVVEFIEASDFESDVFIVDVLPARIQEFLSMGTKTARLLALLDGRGRQND